jgi:hypothetical protein
MFLPLQAIQLAEVIQVSAFWCVEMLALMFQHLLIALYRWISAIHIISTLKRGNEKNQVLELNHLQRQHHISYLLAMISKSFAPSLIELSSCTQANLSNRAKLRKSLIIPNILILKLYYQLL